MKKINLKNLKENINIPIFNKFNDPKSCIMWADNYIKKRGDKVLKKLMNELTTKPIEVNGRINDDCILLKAIK